MSFERQDLVAAFRQVGSRLVETKLAPRSLLVESLDSNNKIFAAVDSDGARSLVVAAQKSSKSIPSLKLSSLSVEYGISYQLHKSDTVEQLRVSVLRCLTPDPAIGDLFATFCIALLDALPDEPSDSDLEREVDKWVALFWRLQGPARTTVIGLIGEVTVLDNVEQLADWVRAWHTSATDNLDFAFSAPSLSVEVKATSGQQRVHELSLHQAMPPITEVHYFASVIVELRETGVRLSDVVEELAEKLRGTFESKLFWQAIAEVCGSSLGEFLDARYLRDVARETLRFYEGETIPKPIVQLPLPAGVSGLRFRSDFSSLEPIESADILGFKSAL